MFQPCCEVTPQTRNDSVRFQDAEGRTVLLDVLHEVQDDDRFARVCATSDRLRAFLEYELVDPDETPIRSMLEELAEAAGIAYGLDPDALDAVLRLFAQGHARVGPFQIAAGRPARAGANGSLDFFVAPSSAQARYKPDESGKIDYRQTHLVENVYAGGNVALIRPPTDGEAGQDIHGNRLPTRAGNPISVRLGQNVRLEEETNRIVADIDGRVVHDDKTVSVTDEYEIRGDVDLSVGNIDFVGKVIVHGGVLDEFQVHGGQSVYIRGVAGACTLTSGGNIRIDGGVAGKGRALVATEGGTVTARYLNESRVEAAGDVRVRNEIVNATVFTGGRLCIERGAVVGGRVCALAGIEAGVLGSSLGVSTRAASGVDWKEAVKRERVESRLEAVVGRAGRLAEYLEPLAEEAGRLKVLPGEERALVREIVDFLRTLHQRQQRLAEELAAMESENPPGAVRQINVQEKVYPGVLLTLGGQMLQVRDETTGPLSALLAPEGDRVRLAPQEPLPPRAAPEEEEEA